MGFEDPACGKKEVSATLVRKETKKEEKHIFTYRPTNSVVTAQADVFAILGNKIVKNLKIFVGVDYLRSRGVLCQP